MTAGVATILLVHWMVAFWVPNEATQGVVQRIFYVHVPAAWTTFLAVGIVALTSAVYLWLEDERADAAAVAAAEGALVFGAIMLITGPLWARIAWGTRTGTWDPRLTLTLILWFTYLGLLPGPRLGGGSQARKAFRRGRGGGRLAQHPPHPRQRGDGSARFTRDPPSSSPTAPRCPATCWPRC